MGKTPEELRAIDAMVEERIMGRKPILFGHSYRSAGTWLSYPPDNLEAEGVIVPNYTTDIAAAWSVVEKMVGKAWDFDIGIAGAFIGCEFENSKGKRGRADLQSSAPLAICLAALSALGENP